MTRAPAQPLSYPGHAGALLRLGLPLIGSHVAQMLISVTDTVMLGWYSVEALAAVVLGSTSIFFVLLIVGTGFAWAVMPMVAQAAAADDDVRIRRVTRMGMWLALAYGALVYPIMAFAATWLPWIGQDPAIAELTQTYLRIAGLGMIPAVLVMVLKSYLSALGRTQVQLWVTLGAAVLNAGLNYVLIFGHFGFPEMGIRGAAWASLAVHIGSIAALILYAKASFPEHALFQRLWRPDWEALREVYRLGWPISLTSLSESGLFAASSFMMGMLGTLQLAAHGIALQLISVTFMVHVGLSQAGTVRTGWAFGKSDQRSLGDGARAVLVMSALASAATIALLLGLPEPLIGLFLSPDEAQREAIIAIGVGLLAVAAVFQFADGIQVVTLGLLRGVQDTRVPMVLAAVSYWIIGLPVAWVLGFLTPLGGIGVWLGLVFGLSCAGASLLWRFWRGMGWQATLSEPT